MAALVFLMTLAASANVGCLFTLWLLWKKTLITSGKNSLWAFLPSALVACGLYALGMWIILQPMQMSPLLFALAE